MTRDEYFTISANGVRCDVRWRIPKHRFKDPEEFFKHVDEIMASKEDQYWGMVAASEFMGDFVCDVDECEVDPDDLQG